MEDTLNWSKKAERDKKIYELIDRNNLVESCGMSREAIYKTIKQATSMNHLAFVLADTANSILIDCERKLSMIGGNFTHQDKRNFKRLVEHTKAALYWSRETAMPIYGIHNDDVDGSCNDSDWYYNLIRLIEEKVAGNEKNAEVLIRTLLSFQDGNGLYDIKYDDFKRVEG